MFVALIEKTRLLLQNLGSIEIDRQDIRMKSTVMHEQQSIELMNINETRSGADTVFLISLTCDLSFCEDQMFKIHVAQYSTSTSLVIYKNSSF